MSATISLEKTSKKADYGNSEFINQSQALRSEFISTRSLSRFEDLLEIFLGAVAVFRLPEFALVGALFAYVNLADESQEKKKSEEEIRASRIQSLWISLLTIAFFSISSKQQFEPLRLVRLVSGYRCFNAIERQLSFILRPQKNGTISTPTCSVL